MAPGIYPLALYAGDTYRWEFLLWEDADKSRPVDLTGAVASAVIRSNDITVAMTCGIVLPNIIEMILPADDCASLGQTGLWDLRVRYPDGDVTTIMRGPVTVMASVAP